MPLAVAFAVFPGAEELDLAGPLEAFSLARDYGDQDLTLFTVAASGEPVCLRGGLRVVPDYSFEDAPTADVVVVPGGPGTRDEPAWRPVTTWLAARVDTPLVASVCTGSFLLARAGLLDGRRATTHHHRLDELREQHPEIEVVAGERVVDEVAVVTAGGVTAGIDLGLYLVERLLGRAVAEKVSDVMEYPFERPLSA